ncbi:MAG: PAS domain S-box protein [Chloroflexi bacterium]|nr:PAS domain S-box protein [Chloroflexota bacterium]
MVGALMTCPSTPTECDAAARFAAVLRAATEYSITGTDLDGVISVFNEGAERMLGYRADEVIGGATPLLIHDPAEVAARAAELGIAPGFEVFVAAARRGAAETREWTYIRKDGSRLTVSLTVTAMRGERGEPIGFIGIAQDITRRKRAEDQVRLLQTLLFAIGEADDLDGALAITLQKVCEATGWILGQAWVPSADGTRLTCSPAWYAAGERRRYQPFRDATAQLAPYPAQGLVGRVWQTGAAVWLRDVSTDPTFVRRAAAAVAHLKAGLAVPVRDGDRVVAILEFYLANPQEQDERLVGIVSAVAAQLGTLVQKKRLLEAERQARAASERLRDEFFANISHDLRTPVAAIKASVGVVLANEPADLPAPLHRLLVNVDQAADRMARLVADLIELTRLHAGRVPPPGERHDLRALALRAARILEALIDTRDQRLELELAPGPVWVAVDVERLERALVNLLTNAHKFGRHGGTIRLTLERTPSEVVLSVADDGPGIPIADQQRIFERFYRPEGASYTQHTQGSGLGLAIAQAVAHLHGGRIWVESRPGAGATFRIALPVDADGSGGAAPVPSSHASGPRVRPASGVS